MKMNPIQSLPFKFKNRVVLKNKPFDENIKNIQFMYKNSDQIKSSTFIIQNLDVLKSNNSAFEIPMNTKTKEVSPLNNLFTIESANNESSNINIKKEQNLELQTTKRITPLLSALSTNNKRRHLQINSLNTLQLLTILNKQSQISNNQSLLPYLNGLTKFNKNLANRQHVLYQFNKANNKSYKFLFDKTSKLLKFTFLSMGCLISRPVYKIVYTINNLEFEYNTPNQDFSRNFTQKVLIDLSYYIRKNKNKYLHNLVEENENIISISHPDSTNKNNDNILANNTANNFYNNTDNYTDNNTDNITDNILNTNNHFNIKPIKSVSVSQRNNILCKYNDKFIHLTDCLNSIFNSEVELNLIRLHKVFYDSHILVQDIALKSYKFRFVKLVSRLFKKLQIQNIGPLNYSLNNSLPLPISNKENSTFSFPSYLSGINIKLAGRTFRQRVIPRMTVKRIQKGSLTNVNVQFIDRARFTGKTRRGAFSFTITLGHVFK